MRADLEGASKRRWIDMTFVEKHRFAGGRSEAALLKIAWDGEIFGVGFCEGLSEKFPEHAEIFTACATMEWLNAHLSEDVAHDGGMHVSLEWAEKLANEGAEFA